MEKAEVKEEGSESSQRMFKGETLLSPYRLSSDQIQESLKIINEETLQLSTFLLQERKLIKELCVLLKHVLSQLNMFFNLPADIFPQTWRTEKIILTDEAHLIFVNGKNEVKSKALEDFHPQIILNVASFIIPKLSQSLTSYRKIISLRIGLFEKINQGLRNLRDTIGEDMNPVDTEVKKASLAKQKGLGDGNKRSKESD